MPTTSKTDQYRSVYLTRRLFCPVTTRSVGLTDAKLDGHRPKRQGDAEGHRKANVSPMAFWGVLVAHTAKIAGSEWHVPSFARADQSAGAWRS